MIKEASKQGKARKVASKEGLERQDLGGLLPTNNTIKKNEKSSGGAVHKKVITKRSRDDWKFFVLADVVQYGTTPKSVFVYLVK